MPLERKLEDFEEQESPEASNNSISVENHSISLILEATIKDIVDKLLLQLLEPRKPAKNESRCGK